MATCEFCNKKFTITGVKIHQSTSKLCKNRRNKFMCPCGIETTSSIFC